MGYQHVFLNLLVFWKNHVVATKGNSTWLAIYNSKRSICWNQNLLNHQNFLVAPPEAKCSIATPFQSTKAASTPLTFTGLLHFSIQVDTFTVGCKEKHAQPIAAVRYICSRFVEMFMLAIDVACIMLGLRNYACCMGWANSNDIPVEYKHMLHI